MAKVGIALIGWPRFPKRICIQIIRRERDDFNAEGITIASLEVGSGTGNLEGLSNYVFYENKYKKSLAQLPE
jgi:hypothetical protein